MITSMALLSHRTWRCCVPLVQQRGKPALNQTPTAFVQQFLKANKRGKTYRRVGKSHIPEKYWGGKKKGKILSCYDNKKN